MSSQHLSDVTWSQVAEFLARTSDAEGARHVLKKALTSEEEAWSKCVETLQLDEYVFLDGSSHAATPLSALRKRAQESNDARDALLPWSAYQQARCAVQKSHAAPVLAAFEEHGNPSTRLEEAYEWALCRSLATVAYHRYPQLNGLTGWQLGNHRAAFQDLEVHLLELERQRIAHELYSRPIEHGESFGGPGAFTEMALIQHQLSLPRRNVTLRNLIHRSGTALTPVETVLHDVADHGGGTAAA